jgi:hypothetical protein
LATEGAKRGGKYIPISISLASKKKQKVKKHQLFSRNKSQAAILTLQFHSIKAKNYRYNKTELPPRGSHSALFVIAKITENPAKSWLLFGFSWIWFSAPSKCSTPLSKQKNKIVLLRSVLVALHQ